jgi:hypothetical protein
MNDKEKIMAGTGALAALGAIAYYLTPKGGVEEKKSEEVSAAQTPDATTKA